MDRYIFRIINYNIHQRIEGLVQCLSLTQRRNGAENFLRLELEPAFLVRISMVLTRRYTRFNTVNMIKCTVYFNCKQGWYHQTSVPFRMEDFLCSILVNIKHKIYKDVLRWLKINNLLKKLLRWKMILDNGILTS